MSKSFVFYDSLGQLGIFQKDEDAVCFFVDSHPITTTGIGDWKDWTNYNQQEHPNNITKETVQFFLRRADYVQHISFNITDFHKVESPGYFYPRIDRNNIQFNYAHSQTTFLQDIRAYQNIQSRLDDIFNYIEPDDNNLKVFSHKIRELLILACTEVECLLVNVLIDNEYPTAKRYTTKDYVKCNELLGLYSYSIVLADYPDLPSFQPFKDWDIENPTKSLTWYDSYNAIKHNRAENMTQANMKHLLDAIAAIHILLESQYGKHLFQRWTQVIECKSIFSTQTRHKWKCSEITAPILIPDYPVRTKWNSSIPIFK